MLQSYLIIVTINVIVLPTNAQVILTGNDFICGIDVDCSGNIVQCNSNEDCSIYCHAALDWNNTTCAYATIICPDAPYSCNVSLINSDSDYLTIDGSNGGDLILRSTIDDGEGHTFLALANIYCPNHAWCNITCDGNRACYVCFIAFCLFYIYQSGRKSYTNR